MARRRMLLTSRRAKPEKLVIDLRKTRGGATKLGIKRK